MPRAPYTPETLARALDAHVAAGRIRGWTRAGDGYTVNLVSLGPVELRTHREAWVLVAALASAAYAATERT